MTEENYEISIEWLNTYRNPANGYEETISKFDVLLALLFGPLYFAAKGAWGWVFITLVFVALPLPFILAGNIIACIVSILLYFGILFNTTTIMNIHFKRLGWIVVK